MTAIRPPAFPPIRTPEPPRASGPDAAKLAAQKAFFQAAFGQAPASQTVSSAPVTPTAAAIPKIPEPGAEKPQKILRPGSLLDIRI